MSAGLQPFDLAKREMQSPQLIKAPLKSARGENPNSKIVGRNITLDKEQFGSITGRETMISS